MSSKKTFKNQSELIFDPAVHLENMLSKALDDDTFVGPTAGVDRAVAASYIRLGLKLGAYTVHPGVRKVAGYAGISQTTVSVAAGRLSRLGWLTVIWRANTLDYNANQIRLNWDSKQFLDYTPPKQPNVFLLHQIDIWSGDGLGMNARTIYQVLLKSPEGKRLKDLETATGLSAKQIRRCIDELTKASLIKKERLVYSNQCPTDEESQKAAALSIRKIWFIDEKEALREQRFGTQREIRKRLYDSAEYQGYQKAKYQNNPKKSKTN